MTHQRHLPRQNRVSDVTEYSAVTPVLLRPDVGLADHLGPLFSFVGDEFAIFGRRERSPMRAEGRTMAAYWQIVLQKSKVAGPRIFRENTKREAIADSYNLNRVTEVACEFSARR